MDNQALIDSAESILNPYSIKGFLGETRYFGQVACSLVTHAGNTYSGVCIDTGSGTGFCAEHAAIAAMVTAREYKIAKIVAVWRDPEGAIVVLPPCGRCREFIRQIEPTNLDTKVVLSALNTARLRDLLPIDGPA
jgi:cytidine deaminase